MGRLYCKALLLAFLSLGTFTVRAQELRKVIEHPQPVFPETAKDMTLKGTVRVEVIVGSDGLIKNTRVIGGHPLLVQATLEALKKMEIRASQDRNDDGFGIQLPSIGAFDRSMPPDDSELPKLGCQLRLGRIGLSRIAVLE